MRKVYIKTVAVIINIVEAVAIIINTAEAVAVIITRYLQGRRYFRQLQYVVLLIHPVHKTIMYFLLFRQVYSTTALARGPSYEASELGRARTLPYITRVTQKG